MAAGTHIGISNTLYVILLVGIILSKIRRKLSNLLKRIVAAARVIYREFHQRLKPAIQERLGYPQRSGNLTRETAHDR
jgi:hypothetical protein